MKAKIITLFLILVASIGTLSAYDAKIGSFYYNLDATNLTATVTYEKNNGGGNYTSTLNVTNANIPSSVTYGGKSYSVTDIGDYAFAGCGGLKSITIPSSITTIGRNAFGGCTGLTSIIIPNSVKYIGYRTFYGCASLTSITVGNGVTSIGDYAFEGCSGLAYVIWNAENCADFTSTSTPFYYRSSYDSSKDFDIRSQITSFVFGNKVEVISANLCSGMNNLTSISIPNSVTNIGNSAFANCKGLTGTLVVPNSVTCIGTSSFSGCTSLTSVAIGNNVTNIGSTAFNNCTGLTNVTIPNSVTSIGDYAFNGCKITTITIPNSVTKIGEGAFRNCSELTSVSFGNSISSFGTYAFQGCTKLSSVIWNVKSHTFTSTRTPFYYFESQFSSNNYDLRDQITSMAFGEGIECIPAYLCYGMSKLPSVIIPNSATSIGSSAFQNCSSITSLEVPNSVTSISGSAFEGCSNLESISIGENVTYIGDRVLRSCNKLKNVVWNVKSYADFTSSKTPFKSTSGYTTETFDLRKQITSFVLGNEVEYIPAYLCDGMNNLSSLIIPNSVISIGQNAFSYCKSVTSFTIPNSVTSIGNSAFYGCSGMSNVIIPSSVTNIGTSVFYGCSSLTSVTIPNSVTGIGNSAFYGCSSLNNITIPATVTSIGVSAFYNCTNLASITIPDNVANIGNYAFSGCSSLTSVVWNAKSCDSPSEYRYAPFSDIRSQINSFTLGNYVESIPAYLCYGMNQIDNITIPNSVESIGGYAFQGCHGLTSLILPQNVTSVGEYSFNHCNSLINVTLQSETPPTLGNNAFSSCNNLSGIYVPCGTLNAYKRSWSNYSSLIAYTPTGYTINAGINMSEAGNVAIFNSVCETSVTANPNYGYHFAQWSDGYTDNPRTIELTQDTSFTAEFAKNSYSIATATSNPEWGSTAGDATVLYQDQVEISATANYGYHFTQWNDYNTTNPRKVTVTADATYTATFAKNTYKITKIVDNKQGSISGSSQAYYLDQVTLTAVPKYGYHFTQWSDGVTDNPRTFELTRDTTFTAEFAVDKSGTCGNNNQLTWEFDAESKTLAISGEGQLNSNYTFGVEAPSQTERLIIEEGVTSIGNNAFKDKCSTITALALPSTVTTIGDYAFAGLSNRKFNTLVLPNTIISIGSHAFDGASYLQTIHFGSVLEEIGDYAFNGCTRVRKMTCLAEITPNVGTDGLTSISDLAELHVPNDYLFDYQLDNNWNRFVLKPIGATEATVTGNYVTIVADENSATITWPTSEADSYTIEITKDGEVFCQLIFNASGQLTSIAFAPSRGGQSMAPAATMTADGMQFTVTGLNSGTNYGYKLEAKSGSATVASYSGSFATTGGIATGIDEVTAIFAPQKILRNGNVLILRDGKTYTVQGQEVR